MIKSSPARSVLIIGGAGFIGSNWAEYLLNRTDAHVHVLDNLSRPGVWHNLKGLERSARPANRLKVTIGDVRDAVLVEKVVASATEVYHFAAQVAVTTSLDDPRSDFDVNVGGTFNVLEAVRKSGNRPFVLFTSTNKVYGHLTRPRVRVGSRSEVAPGDCVDESQPLDFYSPYGCSKGAADQYAHDYARIFGLPIVVFRMSCIAGPKQFGNEDQGWVAHFLYSALQELPLTIYGDGLQVRDVLCVSDLVRAFDAVRSEAITTAGQVYNVGGGLENTISLLELLAEIQKLTGKRINCRFREARPGDQAVYVTDFSKLTRLAGWRPRSGVRNTLADMWDWWALHKDLLVPALTGNVAQGLQTLPGIAS